ncbi:polysaccharide biosynthesis C-terminal domain-containing protein [Paucilactobacillus suebicus]|uniref:PST family polysaccharide transporter n=1 Tax=Paucilactobacillus suebicus DSM 5007 = KCTC 3549 TaxID=1423807 RepID=A0A0R1W3U1_9LACO|nr:polysaccharide biosynthesis C-terminal domain-containing protein [Paucilactobacillus suebicus]KRM12269.1 PST family polysaccharide transporter [Paucilactobacillus suebicus DSM 5007 = KCTC 3549]
MIVIKAVKNYLFNAWYQVFVLIVPLATTPYISRVLGSTGVGINSYTNSIMQFFVIIASIGINLYGNREIAYVRDNPRKMSQLFWEIETLRLVAVGIAAVIFVGFMVVDHEYQSYMWLQSLFIIAVMFDISWLFLGIEDFRKTILKNTVVKLVSVILIFTLVKSISDLHTYILILSGSTLAGNMTLWPYLKGQIHRVPLSSLRLKRHLRPAIILFIPQIATQIYLVLNKTMLGQMVGVSATGYFDNSDKVIKVILAIVTASGTVMLPRVAKTFSTGNMNKVNAYLYETFNLATALAVPMFLGLAAVASGFSTWFFGSNFNGIAVYIVAESPVILMIAWSNVVGTQYLLPTNHNRDYTMSVVLGAIVNLIANIWLIRNYQVLGACLSTVLSEATVTGYQIFRIRNIVNLRRLFSGTWQYLVSGMVMYVVVKYLTVKVSFSIVSFLFEIFAGIVVYLLGLIITRARVLSFVKRVAIRLISRTSWVR